MCKDKANVLNLPAYGAIIEEENGKKLIYDDIRRKCVALTPEEWVRQHFVHYLREHLGYPLASSSHALLPPIRHNEPIQLFTA